MRLYCVFKKFISINIIDEDKMALPLPVHIIVHIPGCYYFMVSIIILCVWLKWDQFVIEIFMSGKWLEFQCVNV